MIRNVSNELEIQGLVRNLVSCLAVYCLLVDPW